MQVSAQNSLTWLQTTPAALAATDSISSADGQVSPGSDASGTDSGLASMSALQSPAQMFAPASLGALISGQSGDSASDASAGSASASATTPGAPAAHHHHHHHGGGAAPATDTQDASSASSATTTGATTATSATASGAVDAAAQTDLSQILASL